MRAVLLVAAVIPMSRVESQEPVPVEQEPRHHLVFERGDVRILDVRIPPGDVTLYHTHDEPILYVPISLSPTDSQILGQDWLGVGPKDRSRFDSLVVASDTSYASTPLTHRVKNVGDRQFRLIAITNTAAGSDAPADDLPGTPVFASRWHRASLLQPGGSAWQPAAAPVIVVQPGPGRSRVERETGEATDLDQPGSWAFVTPGMRYRISNSTAVVVVETRQ